MKRTVLVSLLLTLAATLAAPRVRAAEMPKGFRGVFLTDLADVEKKVEGLAEASWRP